MIKASDRYPITHLILFKSDFAFFIASDIKTKNIAILNY